MHTLILGSFPPHKSKWHYEFYYPNKANHFWKILAHFGKHQLKYFEGSPAVQERQALMKTMKVGVQNLGRIIERKGISSLDTNIRLLEFHDVLSIIKAHPELKQIL